jgi:Altered inheritance of mitochondria protein 21
MSASVAPSIPPRPVRSQKQPVVSDTPKIPPRPSRRVERSASPKRDSFARSPLNESTFTINQSDSISGLYSHGQNLSASNLSPSPPSVTLPSVGQEGAEYSSFCDGPDEQEAASETVQPLETQTRNIESNLKLHAPKPTLPASSAKSRTATVTRTDSTQAAAAGIGHADDKDPHSRPLKTKTSFASHDSSQGIERSASTQPSESEHGIPEIGLRVPMYPNAGDVQAPSPSPHHAAPFSPGIGFHNDGQQRPGRHHKRTLSGRECPPGSYGLHGHGVPNQNKFEKAWYESHPEALEREESGEYGPGLGAARAEWALSSDDLNRVVRETASKGAGYGIFTNYERVFL